MMKSPTPDTGLTVMHVCHLTPGNQNGYEIRVIEETRLLSALGVRVILVCFVRRDRLWPVKRLWKFYQHLKTFTGARVYILPANRYFDVHPPSDGIPGIVRPLVSLAKLHRVKIMHGQALYSTIHLLRAKKHTAARVVFDVHGVSPEESEMSGSHLNRVSRLAEWEQEALHQADLRIFVSDRMKAFFQEKYGLTNPAAVRLPCCVRSEKFHMSEAARQAKRAQLGIEDKFVFVYLGTLSAWQWPEALFATFAQIVHKRPDSFLYLLVPAADHAKAEALLATFNIPAESCWMQEVPHAEVGSMLGIADAGLMLRKFHPVNFVSCPTKCGEYLAAGVPIIASHDIGDISELVDKEQGGIIISPTDEGMRPDDLKRVVQFVSDVQTHRSRWSNRCRTIAQECLDWEKYGQSLVRAYHCMEGNRP